MLPQAKQKVDDTAIYEVRQEKLQAQKDREQTPTRERGHDKDLGFER